MVQGLIPVGATPCPLLRVMPKVKQTGNTDADGKVARDRSRFMDSVDLLWQYPAIRADALDSLKSLAEAHLVSSTSVNGDLFLEPPGYVGKIDEEFNMMYFIENFNVTPARMGQVLSQDPRAGRQLQEYFLKATLMTVVPKECQQRVVLRCCYDRRMEEVGRVAKWKGTFGQLLTVEGKLKWSLGVYKPVWKDEEVAEMIHVDTNCKRAMKADVTIDDTWNLEQNWSDLGCHWKKGKIKVFIKDSFDKGTKEGPHCLPTWQGTEPLFAKLAASSQQDAKLAVHSIQASELVLAELSAPAKDKRKDAAQGTAAKLQQRKEEAQKKRRITFDKTGKVTNEP